MIENRTCNVMLEVVNLCPLKIISKTQCPVCCIDLESFFYRLKEPIVLSDPKNSSLKSSE